MLVNLVRNFGTNLQFVALFLIDFSWGFYFLKQVEVSKYRSYAWFFSEYRYSCCRYLSSCGCNSRIVRWYSANFRFAQ